jgi:hypothetical protein
LKLSQNPGFPSHEILESRMKITLLENENFNRLHNSTTYKRASRLSMEDAGSVGAILATLLSSKKLEKDSIEFFKNFYARKIDTRTGIFKDILVVLIVLIELIACGVFVYRLIPVLKSLLKSGLKLGYYILLPFFLFKKGKEFLSKKYQDNQNVVTTNVNQEKLQKGDDTKINIDSAGTAPTINMQYSEISNRLEKSEGTIPSINQEGEDLGTTQTQTTSTPNVRTPTLNVETSSTPNVGTAPTKNIPTKNADPNSLSNSLINHLLTFKTNSHARDQAASVRLSGNRPVGPTPTEYFTALLIIAGILVYFSRKLFRPNFGRNN